MKRIYKYKYLPIRPLVLFVTNPERTEGKAGNQRKMKIFQRLILFLLSCTAVINIADAKVLEVSIDLKDPRGTTSDRFLSVTLDASLLSRHWKGFDFTDKGVKNMAHGLAPAFLRIGGTREDFLTFNPREFNLSKEGEFTARDWDTVNEFGSSVEWDIIFGINVLTRKPGHPWNPSNALELLRYTSDHGYEVNWELGNGETWRHVHIIKWLFVERGTGEER